VREGKILGNYIKQHFKGQKIGYFYQDDEFGQDGVKGLDYEIPKSQVVARQSYNPTVTNVAPQVTALKAAGAQVVVSFSVPAFTALLKLNMLKLNFNPQLVVSDVGSDPITLAGLLESFAKQGGATVSGNQLTQGIITDGYLPSLGNTSNSWIQLFTKIHNTYLKKLPLDGNVAFGMAVGYTFVQAMLKAGRNPTRQDLINAINSGLPAGPSVAPYAFSKTNHDGITGAYMAEVKNGALTPLGPVQVTDTSAGGAVTTYSTSQQAAPASGIPSP
jgi:branched-chain amino acid transport system substrate-binding protein